MHEPKIITSREIGEKVRKRRQEVGISQERLAEILNVSYQQVQRYENGTNRLNVENLQLIARALSVPVANFFQGDYPQAAAETPPEYEAEEEKNLLRLFRKIEKKVGRQMVINVARLAAKK